MSPTPPPPPPSSPAPAPRLSATAAAARARGRAAGLASWEGEGGAALPPDDTPTPALPSELLRQRVIALESLVIALLATASEAQREQALAMADFISPRPGHTAHALTLRAAGRMRSLLDRSRRFGPVPPADGPEPASQPAGTHARSSA